jgi:hypothetical protein
MLSYALVNVRAPLASGKSNSKPLARGVSTPRVHSYRLLPERGAFTQDWMLPEVRGGVEGAEPECAYET